MMVCRGMLERASPRRSQACVRRVDTTEPGLGQGTARNLGGQRGSGCGSRRGAWCGRACAHMHAHLLAAILPACPAALPGTVRAVLGPACGACGGERLLVPGVGWAEARRPLPGERGLQRRERDSLALGHLPTRVTVQRAGVGAAAAFTVSQTMVRSPRCVPAHAPHVALRPARGRVVPVS